ncbi:multinuclear nonheme iron-dependent oxidase [Pseudomonas frederiksbergensis]|uniref:multinuclear nonheme iron-dependent oxidase n=1 Tax=Pseudomonas frederiksbergensis TaxID=104087 RepID=UPI0032E4194E
MGMFDASSYPEAGVGLEYHLPRRRAQDDRSEDGLDPTVERILAEGLPHFDYVEFQPTHCILQPRLLDVSARVPSLLHSSSLSLGSVGIAMDREFLHMTRRLCDKTRSPWLAEHISWSRFHGGDTQHFILPTLAQEVADTVVANAIELRELTATLLVLENAPRLFSLPGAQEQSEGEFISSVVARSGSGFLLDLDSAITTARTQGYDLNDYLRSLPLDRLIEIHTSHPRRDWDILRELFKSSPVKAITLEWDISRKTDDAELLTLIKAIKSLRPKALFWQGLDQQGDQQTPSEGAQTLLKLRESTWLSVGSASFFIRDRQQDLSLEFDVTLLPLLRHFLSPQTLESALLLPGVLQSPAQDDNLAFLKTLVSHGVLLPVVNQSCSVTYNQGKHSLNLWTRWDAALEFYLSTRTGSHTPYISVAELETELEQKASAQPQPSAFKDYWSHPFIALENPLLPACAIAQPTLLDSLCNRRTSRTFSDQPLSSEQLSLLLYYTWGATVVQHNRMGDYFLKKTSPAGGSLQGTEVYAVLMNVQGFERGLYHYSVRRHGLELLSLEDPRVWISEACGGQTWIEEAAAVFVSTARVERMAWKYEFSRALRVALMDAGHLSQTFSLLATALGLGSFTTAALRDEMFENRLGLDYLEEPVFLVNGVGG